MNTGSYSKLTAQLIVSMLTLAACGSRSSLTQDDAGAADSGVDTSSSTSSSILNSQDAQDAQDARGGSGGKPSVNVAGRGGTSGSAVGGHGGHGGHSGHGGHGGHGGSSASGGHAAVDHKGGGGADGSDRASEPVAGAGGEQEAAAGAAGNEAEQAAAGADAEQAGEQAPADAGAQAGEQAPADAGAQAGSSGEEAMMTAMTPGQTAGVGAPMAGSGDTGVPMAGASGDGSAGAAAMDAAGSGAGAAAVTVSGSAPLSGLSAAQIASVCSRIEAGTANLAWSEGGTGYCARQGLAQPAMCAAVRDACVAGPDLIPVCEQTVPDCANVTVDAFVTCRIDALTSFVQYNRTITCASMLPLPPEATPASCVMPYASCPALANLKR